MNFLSTMSYAAAINGAVEAWEQHIEQLSNVARVTLTDYAQLKSYFQHYSDADTYLTSPAYYFFTGRNGLWTYSKGEQKILFCWHPNREGQVLIFPPVDNKATALLAELLQILPVPPSGLKLARMKAGTPTDNLVQHLKSNGDRLIEFSIQREDVLDWRYPVRVLSTALVARTVGNKFRNVRKGLIHAQKHSIRKVALSLATQQQDLRQLLHEWASQSSKTKEEYADLYETYDSLFVMAAKATHAIDGLVYYVGDKIEAISLWETPSDTTNTANLYANFCNTSLDGLAEYTFVSICDVLSNKGIEMLNLGGSETSSLDFFKNKFRPAVSIDLCSIDIKLDALEKSSPKQRNAEIRYA